MFSKYFYFNKNTHTYEIPLYLKYSPWLIGSFFTFVISNELYNRTSLLIFRSVIFISLVTFVVLTVIGITWVIVGLICCHGVINLLELSTIRSILLNNLRRVRFERRLKDTDYIKVPAVMIKFKSGLVYLRIRKIEGLEVKSIDELVELVNTSFVRGKFKNFAVVRKMVTDDGLYFKFVLEDVGTDKTFIPRSITDLKQPPYYLKLQEGLTINLSKLPHLAVWGQSGSGKTTVLMNIIAQCLSNNADLYFLDGKTEFSSFGVFYPTNKIATDNRQVLKLLQHVSETIKKRQKLVADEVKKRNKLGLTGYEIGLQPIIIIGDEIGSIVAGMTSKDKKEFIALLTQVVQKGRSVSVFAILASQSPSVDVLPQGIRSQFSTKILLGSASGDVQRMAFGEAITSGNVEKYQGYYYVDGLTIEPQKFFVPNLFKYDLENMQTFEKLYELGKQKE